VKARADQKVEKQELREKYDPHLEVSDDSSDEEVLLRTGNVPREWYDLYDHKGYSVKGEAVTKMVEGDELAKFIER
jgi:ribosome biogenesis protein ERB1